MLGAQKFLEAVKAGDTGRVKQMLMIEPRLANAREESGASAILLAIYSGKEEIRDLLLAHGAELNIFEAAAAGNLERVVALENAASGSIRGYSHDGFTPLHLAAFFGHRSVAEFLLEGGADANALSMNPNQLRPIHSAVAHHRPGVSLEIARALIDHGAEVNATQQDGWTPLHQAAAHGHTEMIELLLAQGADASAKSNDGQTPLAMAEDKGQAEAAALLRERGAKS